MHAITERKRRVACVCVCVCTSFQDAPRAVCVCNFLFVHIPNIFGNWRAEERYFMRQRGETRQKKRLIEMEGWGRGENMGDNKSSLDFTEAYFINHVNKSW